MERSDLSVCADIADAAFHADELFSRIYTRYHEFPTECRAWWLTRLKQRIVEPQTIALVAEEASDKDSIPTTKKEVVGFAVYLRLGKDARAQEMLRKDTLLNSECLSLPIREIENLFFFSRRCSCGLELERYLLSWDLYYLDIISHTDRDALKKFRDTHYETFSPLEASGCWYLANLAVPPTHQRRGIGGTLLTWGTNTATKDRLPIALEASAMGRGVYMKHGFKVVERQQLLEGSEGVAMIWEYGKGGEQQS